MPDVHYAFLDESSSLGSNDPFFVVALLLVEPSQQKQIERIPKKVSRRYLKKRKRSTHEMKFYNTTPTIRRKTIGSLSPYNVKIIVLAIEKEGRKVKDTPQNYGLIVGYAVNNYFKHFQTELNLTVDKKYTALYERAAFEQTLRQSVQGLRPNQKLSRITHGESHHNHLIQLADFIAGAANQKYNRGDPGYLDLVKEKIIIERKIIWRELKAEFKTKK